MKRIFLFILIITGSILAIWGLLEYYKLIPARSNPEFGSRITASFSNPNHFAVFLETIFLPLFAYLLTVRKIAVKYILLVLIAILYFNILVVETRGMWLSLFLSFVLFISLILYYRSSLLKSNRMWVLTPLIVFLSITTILTFSNPLKDTETRNIPLRIKPSIESLKEYQKADFSLKERIYIWEITLEAIKNNVILGTGYGSFENSFITYREQLYRDQAFAEKYPPAIFKNIKKHAHNEYLHIFSESGIGALLFYILFFISMILNFKKIIKDRADDFTFSLNLAVFCSIISLLIHMSISYPLHIFPANIIFWTYAALLTV